MQSELLIPFGLQQIATGVILYTLYELQSKIDAANENLQARSTGYRFIQVDGPSRPLPQPRAL